MKTLFFGLMILLSTQAQAATAITCGSGDALDEAPFFSVPEIQIASESDTYKGRAGGEWDFRLLAYAGATPRFDQAIAAMTKNDRGQVVVTVRLVRNDGMSPTGLKYVFTDIYADEPTVERFAEGGFAGGSKTGQFSCIAVID